MLLRDIVFERFPVYIQWHKGKGWTANSIVIGYDGHYLIDSHTLYSDEKESSTHYLCNHTTTDFVVLHWEYLDNESSNSSQCDCDLYKVLLVTGCKNQSHKKD